MLSSLADARESGAKVIFIYLAEAHAADSWPLSPSAQNVHRSLEQRLAAAKLFFHDNPMLAVAVDEWYVDALDDCITKHYGLWPERYLLLDGPTVKWNSTLSYEDRHADIPALLRDAAHTIWKRPFECLEHTAKPAMTGESIG